VSDIRVQMTKDGRASVEFSDNFLSLPLADQRQELEALLCSCTKQFAGLYPAEPTFVEVKTRLLQSALSALEEGILLQGVIWHVKGQIANIGEKAIQDYWLRLNR
jgi:hypothetical protein